MGSAHDHRAVAFGVEPGSSETFVTSLEVSTLDRDQILEEVLADIELETPDEIDTVLVLRNGDGEKAAPLVAHPWTAAGGDF